MLCTNDAFKLRYQRTSFHSFGLIPEKKTHTNTPSKCCWFLSIWGNFESKRLDMFWMLRYFFYQEALHWLIFTNIPKLQSSIETTTDGCEGDIKGRIHGPNCLRIGILHQIGAYLGDNGDRKCWCIDVEGTFRESNWRITNGLMDRNPIADMETYRVPVWRAGGEMVMPLQTLINILLLYPHSFSEPWNILGSQPFWLEMRGPEVDSLDLTCLSIIFIKIKCP